MSDSVGSGSGRVALSINCQQNFYSLSPLLNCVDFLLPSSRIWTRREREALDQHVPWVNGNRRLDGSHSSSGPVLSCLVLSCPASWMPIALVFTGNYHRRPFKLLFSYTSHWTILKTISYCFLNCVNWSDPFFLPAAPPPFVRSKQRLLLYTCRQ